MSLTGLPYEVLSIITEELDLEDIFNLGLTCPRLLYLIQDNRTCRGILEVLLLPSHHPAPSLFLFASSSRHLRR